MIIGGEYSLNIKINDEKYDLITSPAETLAIYESVYHYLPTLEISLVDNKAISQLPPIIDGSKIQIRLHPLGDSSKSEDWMTFRSFGLISSNQSGSDKVTLSGYYDSPDYFKDAKFYSVRGLSREVARRVAKDAGLQFSGDSTNDDQEWIRSGVSGAQFLGGVVRHSYIDNSSAFCVCVTRDGELRFYNIGLRRKGKINWKFIEYDIMSEIAPFDVIPISSPIVDRASGLFNKWRGYGTYSVQKNLITNNLNQIFIDTMDKSVDYLNINTDLINPSRYESGPFYMGNTHENYYKARVQNQRVLSTFSSGLTVMTNVIKDVHLLDRIRAIIKSDTEASLQGQASGDYFVDSIATIASNNSVFCKYHLCKEGINSTKSVGKLL